MYDHRSKDNRITKRERAGLFMWKSIVSSLVGVSLILCGFVGVSKLKERLPTQEPIEVETVKDAPAGERMRCV